MTFYIRSLLLSFFILSVVLTTAAIADDWSPSTAITYNTNSITTTTSNPDGSSVFRVDTLVDAPGGTQAGTTITTVVQANMSCVKTTDNADGSSIQTVNNSDGSSVKFSANIDGSWSLATMSKDGILTRETSDSASASGSASPKDSSSLAPKSSPSSGEPPAPTPQESDPFKLLVPPFSINQVPVYYNKEEKGKNGVPFFYISESCITGNMYCAFLNAVAKTGDPDGLYCSDMANVPEGPINWKNNRRQSSPNVAQIKKTTTSDGLFSYELVDPASEVKMEIPGARTYMIRRGNLPITHVNLLHAACFCNWLHNGQHIAPEGPGNTTDGAYLLDNGYYGAFSTNTYAKMDTYLSLLTGVKEQPGALWVIPSSSSYVGSDVVQGQSRTHQSGLYENYGMFYSQPEIWEWTSTRGKPQTYSDRSYQRDYHLTGAYCQVSGSQSPREKYAAEYQSEKVPKRPGENSLPADPSPTKRDGFTSFRVMNVTGLPL